MNISWVNLDRHSLKFMYAKNTLNESEREAYNTRFTCDTFLALRFARYNEVAVVVAPRTGPRREHRGQIIWGPE